MKKYYVEKGTGKHIKWRCMFSHEPWTDNVLEATIFDEFDLPSFHIKRKIWPCEYINKFKNSVIPVIKRFALDPKMEYCPEPF